mgnify:CR=1 FL=1
MTESEAYNYGIQHGINLYNLNKNKILQQTLQKISEELLGDMLVDACWEMEFEYRKSETFQHLANELSSSLDHYELGFLAGIGSLIKELEKLQLTLEN